MGKIIGIDARDLFGNKTGIAKTIESIVYGLNQIENDENEYILYSNKDIELDFELKDNFTKKHYNGIIGTTGLYFNLPKILNEDDVDLFWGTQHVLPARNKYTENIKYLLTIHDIALLILDDHVGSYSNYLIHKVFLKKSLNNANRIIPISISTKNDIIEHYGVDEDKIKVIYWGTNYSAADFTKINEKKILNKFGLKKDNFLFFLSTIEPRKNVITIVKAFELLKEENPDLKLVLAGKLGWKYKKLLNYIKNSKFNEDIILPGYISNEEKEVLFKDNACFVYPSLYEGFGLPILEAMSRGNIVVTSNVSSMPEVGKDAAFYINDVYDFNELADVISEVLDLHIEEKERRIKRGREIVDEFSWEKCVREIYELFQVL